MAASVAALQAHTPDILWLSAYDAAGLTIVPGSPDTATEILDFSGNGADGTVYGFGPPEMSGAYTTHHGASEFPVCSSVVRHRYTTTASTLSSVTLTYMGPMTPTLTNTGSEVQLIHTGLSFASLHWRWASGDTRQVWWSTSPSTTAAVADVPVATSWPAEVADEDAVVIYGIVRSAGTPNTWRLMAAYGDSTGLVAWVDEEITESATGPTTDHTGLMNEGQHAAGMTMVAYRAMGRDELVETLVEMAEFHSAGFAAALSTALSPTPGTYDCDCPEVADGYTVILDVGGTTERWDQVRVPLSERVPFFDSSPQTRDVSLALTPRVLDLPALVAAGHDPSDALLRVYDGDDLVFAGRALGSLRWGRAGSAIRLTATESPWADGSTIPASWAQRVTVIDPAVQSAVQSANRGGIPMSAWGYYEREDLRGDPRSPPIVSALGYDLYVDRVEGRAGPIVFGAPGYQDGESWPATPAYWIDTTEDAEQLQIARHRVAATSVTIYGPCVDGEIRGKVASVAHVRTLEGIEVAVAEVGPLLGRGPVLTITIGHSGGASYVFAGAVQYRSLGGAISSGTFSASWSAGADATATSVAAMAALATAGFSSPWVTGTSDVTGSTITLVYVLLITRGEYGIPHDVDVTTQTASAGSLSHTTDHVAGSDVAAPTDFRPDTSAEWAVAWTGGEALPGGAGDVVRYVLDQTRIRVDRAHVDSWRRELNRYTLAGCIDEEVDAASWLASQLSWLPIGWVQGRDGLRLWVYDPEAPPVATLDEDLGLTVEGDAGTTEEQPVARVEISYRVGEDRASGRLSTRQQTVWSEAARGGEVVKIETDLCDETATAERAATLRQRALHVRHLLVGGTLSRASWGWLRAGDPVDVVALSRGISGRGIVLEIADDGGPLLRVELLTWRGSS